MYCPAANSLEPYTAELVHRVFKIISNLSCILYWECCLCFGHSDKQTKLYAYQFVLGVIPSYSYSLLWKLEAALVQCPCKAILTWVSRIIHGSAVKKLHHLRLNIAQWSLSILTVEALGFCTFFASTVRHRLKLEDTNHPKIHPKDHKSYNLSVGIPW